MILDVADPAGATAYSQLLEASATVCSYFLLVVRESLGLDSDAQRVLTDLLPYLVDEAASNSWPGTVLFSELAIVRIYRLDSESMELLVTLASAFTDWVQPALPEDLCLLRSDGSAWLTSIAHEGDVFVDCQPQEERAWGPLAAVGSLVERVDEDA